MSLSEQAAKQSREKEVQETFELPTGDDLAAAERAATHIQARFRGSHARRETGQKKQHVLKIQSMVRGTLARKKVEDNIVEKFWQRLINEGYDVWIRPRDGPPKLCVMWAQPEHLRVYVHPARLTYPPTSITGLRIMDIAEVRQGINTRSFEQHFQHSPRFCGVSNADTATDLQRCFSLVGTQATLDLEAYDYETALEIQQGIRILAKRTKPAGRNAVLMRDRHPELVRLRSGSALDVGDIAFAQGFVHLMGNGLEVRKVYTSGHGRTSVKLRTFFIDQQDPRGVRLCLARLPWEGERPFKGLYANDVSLLRQGTIVSFEENSHTETNKQRARRLYLARRCLTIVSSERSLCMQFPDTRTRDRVMHGLGVFLRLNGIVLNAVR